ncbi:hypothetical protein BC629DRAFT_1726376 [Irpex lacteus]|nr:hypothetical protein BC629DRAFT_1726376 [Irpex lacteus]
MPYARREVLTTAFTCASCSVGLYDAASSMTKFLRVSSLGEDVAVIKHEVYLGENVLIHFGDQAPILVNAASMQRISPRSAQYTAGTETDANLRSGTRATASGKRHRPQQPCCTLQVPGYYLATEVARWPHTRSYHPLYKREQVEIQLPAT